MGNSKDRRKAKRQPQAQGLQVPHQPPMPPQRKNRKQFWQRVPGWLWTVIVAFSVLITVAEGYPWLSIQEGPLLEPSNLYSELWNVSNGGYIPLTNLDVTCSLNFKGPHIHFNGNSFTYTNFAWHLAHGAQATIPCFHIYSGKSGYIGATLDVEIEYAIYHLNWKPLRRLQTFHFESVGSDGAPQHWIFLAPKD